MAKIISKTLPDGEVDFEAVDDRVARALNGTETVTKNGVKVNVKDTGKVVTEEEVNQKLDSSSYVTIAKSLQLSVENALRAHGDQVAHTRVTGNVGKTKVFVYVMYKQDPDKGKPQEDRFTFILDKGKVQLENGEEKIDVCPISVSSGLSTVNRDLIKSVVLDFVKNNTEHTQGASGEVSYPQELAEFGPAVDNYRSNKSRDNLKALLIAARSFSGDDIQHKFKAAVGAYKCYIPTTVPPEEQVVSPSDSRTEYCPCQESSNLCLDMSLLIRLLEYSKESAKEDVDLHFVAEELQKVCDEKGCASMDDYEKIISKSSAPEEESSEQEMDENWYEPSEDEIEDLKASGSFEPDKGMTEEVSDATVLQAGVKANDKYRLGQGVEREKRFRQADYFLKHIQDRLDKYEYSRNGITIRPVVVATNVTKGDSGTVKFLINVKAPGNISDNYPFKITFDLNGHSLVKKETSDDYDVRRFSEEAFSKYNSLCKMMTKLAVDFANLNANEHADEYRISGDNRTFKKIGDAMRASADREDHPKVEKIDRKTISLQELKNLVFETYCEVLEEGILLEDEEKDDNMIYSEGEVLPDSTDQMLAKFPTLKHCLQRLHTDAFNDFVSSVDWVSPKPTEFRINLSNGQSYTLKWLGKDFEATISGKKYYLGQLTGFQQALNKLSILYKEGPMGQSSDSKESGAGSVDSGFSGGGGGGNFPGAEGGVESSSEEPQEPAGEAGKSSEEEEDLSTQNIDFEEPSES